MIRTVSALLALTAAAAPAAADPPAHHHLYGECELREVVAGTYVLHAEVVAYSFLPGHDPVTMDSLRCDLVVNGTEVASFPGRTAGPAGVVPPASVALTFADTDSVQLCLTAHLTDAHWQAETVVDCGVRDTEYRPPGKDLVDDAQEHLVWPLVDPLVCAATGGDVYYPTGDLLWDCPPYGPVPA